MQKSLIVLLAVCLISVHAFVKRDAPAAPAENSNYLETIQKQFGDLSKQLDSKIKETFNAEEIKKGFNDAINNLNKAFDDLKTKSATQKEGT